MSTFNVGDLVRFYPVAGRRIHSKHRVVELYPNGIPSCREPMLKLDGKAGVVLAAHCKPAKEPWVPYCSNCQTTPYDSCGCP